MASYSAELQESALGLAWSLWAELGVSGWQRHNADQAIDPESLIIFTAWLGDADPRLRDESLDWCIRFGRYVSGTRLKNFLAEESEDRRRSFGWYAATVAAHSALRWPGATDPRRHRPTGRSRLEDIRAPSLITLRLRALFGVTARSEILRMFLANPGAAASAAELVPDVGYTKRNVADALEALRAGGLLEVAPWRNQLRYHLARAEDLVGLVGDVPASFPRWRFLLRVLARVLETARTVERVPRRARAVEIDKAVHGMAEDLRAAGLSSPRPRPGGDVEGEFWPWALGLAHDLVPGSGRGTQTASRTIRRTRRSGTA
jgi:hypothetical protein